MPSTLQMGETSLCKWGGQMRPGVALPFVGGILRKKSLGHPAKAQNLKILKLGFHPHTKPTCPRGGSLN